nr:hypothetical protein [uncultured bacterium]
MKKLYLKYYYFHAFTCIFISNIILDTTQTLVRQKMGRLPNINKVYMAFGLAL